MDVQNANASLAVASPVYYAYANSDDIHKVDFTPVFFFYIYEENLKHFQLIKEETVNALAKKIYDNYLNDSKSLRRMINNHLLVIKKMDQEFYNYSLHRNNLSAELMFNFFKKFLDLSLIFWKYSSIGEDKGEIIDSVIIPKFAQKQKMNLKNAREIFTALSWPEEMSFLNLERMHFLELCLLIIKNKQYLNYLSNNQLDRLAQIKEINRSVGLYLKENFWIKSDFCKSRVLSVNSVLNDLKNEIQAKGRKKISQELYLIKNTYSSALKRKKILSKKIKLSRIEKANVNFAAKTIYWIDQRKLGQCKFFYYSCLFFEDLEKFFGIKYDDLLNYDCFDILNFLKRKEKIKPQVMSSRKKSFLAVFENNKKISYFYGKEVKAIFLKSLGVSGQETKGRVASTGNKKIIRAIARIVSNPLRDTFNKNEILITSMTRIEFVPLMRKAVAIVTNEGGIACHAAVVSRELGIPCVIGTKDATKIFKDGDKIEVNTSTGVIRKIK